jgi:hypothetical protein
MKPRRNLNRRVCRLKNARTPLPTVGHDRQRAANRDERTRDDLEYLDEAVCRLQCRRPVTPLFSAGGAGPARLG